jgi:hypothetical protein
MMKVRSKILEFDQQEFDEAIENGRYNLEETGQTMDEFMDLSFQSLLFLGHNVIGNNDLFNVAIFNIRLCYVYYKEKENYSKLAEIVSLVKVIETLSRQVVDKSIIDEICINLN